MLLEDQLYHRCFPLIEPLVIMEDVTAPR